YHSDLCKAYSPISLVPITLLIGGIVRESCDPHVATDDVGEYWISTVWLSSDHSFSRFFSREEKQAPIIFETMIFCDDEKIENHFTDYQERYCNVEEAELGHQKAVQMVKDYLSNKE